MSAAVLGCFARAQSRARLRGGPRDQGAARCLLHLRHVRQDQLYNEESIIGKKCERAGLHLLLDKSQLYFHNHRLKTRSKNFLQTAFWADCIIYL